MRNYAIQTHQLSRSFGSVQAVVELSLSIQTGEIFGFLGHNGAGKTTTVRLLNGVLKSDSGSSKILGYNPQTEGTVLRSRTGVLTETPSLDERLTARENLTIYADLYGIPIQDVWQRVDSALEQFGLSERGSDKVGSFSKGMKQRLALARAFIHEPELIFLDEPTSGLDPIAAQEVHDMIRHVSADEGRTVFLCTHNLVEAQRLCNRVGVMEAGRMVAVGTPQELAREIGAEIRYILDVNQSEKARKVLQQMPAVSNIQFQDKLSFAIQNRETIPDVLSALLAQEIRVYEVTPQQITLEDIYMALHHRQGVDA